MESRTANDIALRLLELEQRFESYCALHEEELREIQATLNQLREDILRLGRGPETDLEEDDLAVVPGDDVSGEDTRESPPVLAL
jgi:hypothetical protein